MYKRIIELLKDLGFNFTREPTNEEIDEFIHALRIRKLILSRLTLTTIESCAKRYLPYACLSLNEAEAMDYERALIAELSELVDEL